MSALHAFFYHSLFRPGRAELSNPAEDRCLTLHKLIAISIHYIETKAKSTLQMFRVTFFLPPVIEPHRWLAITAYPLYVKVNAEANLDHRLRHPNLNT